MIKLHINFTEEVKNCSSCPLCFVIPLSTQAYCNGVHKKIEKDYKYTHSDLEEVPTWCPFRVKE